MAKSELKLQKMIVDTVNDAGGFAHKMSNRFLIGVSDLLVKLPPGHAHRIPGIGAASSKPFYAVGAGLLEVKQRVGMPKDEQFGLEVTRQQGKFLQAAYEGGMPTGVASFIQVERDILLSVRPWGDARIHGYDVVGSRSQHLSLGPKAEQSNSILTHLYNWMRECRGN